MTYKPKYPIFINYLVHPPPSDLYGASDAGMVPLISNETQYFLKKFAGYYLVSYLLSQFSYYPIETVTRFGSCLVYGLIWLI